MFDQISGDHGVVKFTWKINHHSKETKKHSYPSTLASCLVAWSPGEFAVCLEWMFDLTWRNIQPQALSQPKWRQISVSRKTFPVFLNPPFSRLCTNDTSSPIWQSSPKVAPEYPPFADLLLVCRKQFGKTFHMKCMPLGLCFVLDQFKDFWASSQNFI